tara:strand:+ start:439 stop:2079 length:1641 start_codon:yes stop_codon:yes gene_type:complete
MSLVIQPRRRRPVDGAVTLLHLSDDDLRAIFGLVDMPFALKLTCTALRSAYPDKTETSVKHVVKSVGLMAWAHECGLLQWLVPDQVACQAAKTWPGGDEALTFLTMPRLYGHDIQHTLDVRQMCRVAASTGLIPMLEWLNYQSWAMGGNPCDHAAALSAAARSGHLPCLKWMCTKNPFWYKRDHPEQVLNAAANEGHVEVARWLMENGAQVGQEAVKLAAVGGHVPMLVDLLDKGAVWTQRTWHDMYKYLESRYNAYCQEKPIPLPTLQFLVTTQRYWHRRQAWVNAVTNGHVEAVEWLLGQEPDVAPYWGRDDDAGLNLDYSPNAIHEYEGLGVAAYRGHTSMLACAHRNGVELTEELCIHAAAGGHLETIKWLHAHDAPTSRYAVHEAAGRGDLEMLTFMHAHGYEFDHDVYVCAVESSKLDVLEWAHAPSVSCPLPTAPRDKRVLMDAAVDAADTKVLQWLLDRNAGRLWRCHSYNAAGEGNLVLLEWLLRNGCPYDLDALERAAKASGYETEELICKLVKDLRNGTLPPLAPYPERGATVEK